MPRGRRIGVVGPSGSGKSTLASLLLRFVDPVAGSVSLGGVDLPRLALDDVRRTVGLVDDDPHVFATTVAENVRLARPGASDDEVDAALRGAGLEIWLDGLAEGLATRLGDGAPRSRAASARVWPSPGRCWPTSGCSSSTSRRPISTTPRPSSWPPRCSPRTVSGRSSGSPTSRSGSTMSTRSFTSPPTTPPPPPRC